MSRKNALEKPSLEKEIDRRTEWRITCLKYIRVKRYKFANCPISLHQVALDERVQRSPVKLGLG